MVPSISIVAPASWSNVEHIDDAVDALKMLGVDARVPASFQRPNRYLAGPISHRLECFYEAYDDPDTQAVWAVRGGYGCAQLANHIDWSRLSPKPLIGYSDITVLLDQCYRHGLPAIHGPVMEEAVRLRHKAHEQRSIAKHQFQKLLSLLQGSAPVSLPVTRYPSDKPSSDESCHEGPVVGGNLTTLASLAGTPMGFTAPPGALIILEDVGEPYYRLERALCQLKSSSAFDQASAICMGSFTNCTPYADMPLEAIFADVLRPLGLPLFSGLPVGHGLNNHPWRYGAKGRIIGNRLELT